VLPNEYAELKRLLLEFNKKGSQATINEAAITAIVNNTRNLVYKGDMKIVKKIGDNASIITKESSVGESIFNYFYRCAKLKQKMFCK